MSDSSPTIFNKRDTLSKRKRAHTMFLAGSPLEEVIAALELKRTTASVYLYEARQMHAAMQNDDITK